MSMGNNCDYTLLEDIPITFGPLELAGIMGISRNKAYDWLDEKIQAPDTS